MSLVRFSSAGAEPNFLAYSSAEYLHHLHFKFRRMEKYAKDHHFFRSLHCIKKVDLTDEKDEAPPVLWQGEALKDTRAEDEKGKACCMVTLHFDSLKLLNESVKLSQKLKNNISRKDH